MSDLAEGSIIAGCQLEGVAGRGGMGVVYRATQLALGRPVAVKAIAGDLAQDGDYRERFERESRLAASIDHPNIIPVYEAGDYAGTLYLIMRWVDGTDLRAVLRTSGRLGPPRALRLLRPVASALAAAHRAGLVHRDIKPANVLIARGDAEDEEHVYLTDFGIARRTSGESAMTRTGMFVGTIDYTAPERIEGGKGDATSDVYSFGCMLFETLTGHVPYDRPSEVAKVFAHMNDPVPLARAEVPEVPEALDAIIAKAMAKEPGERFSSAGGLAAELGEVLHELETEERRVTGRSAGAEAEPAPATAATALAAPDHAPPSGRPRDLGEVRIQRARRRWPLLATAGGVAAVIAVVLVIALGGGGGGGGGGGPGATTTKSISGAGLSEESTVDLGGRPAALTVGPTGNLWASLPDDGAIARIGAAAGRPLRFSVGGHPGAIAAGPNGLWVAGSAAGSLVRFDLRTGRAAARAQLSSIPSLLAVEPSDASVWAVDATGALTHLSPAGAVLGTAASLSPRPAGVAAGEGRWLWAVNGDLVRVGATGSPTTFSVGPDAVAIALDQGVWTAHATGHVTRFDPRPANLKVNTDRAVASELDGIAALENSPNVWAISKHANTLYRLATAAEAPVTGRVRFGSAPVAVAATAGGAWVATADGNVVEISG